MWFLCGLILLLLLLPMLTSNYISQTRLWTLDSPTSPPQKWCHSQHAPPCWHGPKNFVLKLFPGFICESQNKGECTHCDIRRNVHWSSTVFCVRRCEEKRTADMEAEPFLHRSVGVAHTIRTEESPVCGSSMRNTRHCYSKGHLHLFLSLHPGSGVHGFFSHLRVFVRYDGLHESYLRELGGQTDCKDFSTSAAGIKMDITNYQSVSETVQSDLPGPLSRNTLSATSGGAGIWNPVLQGNSFLEK